MKTRVLYLLSFAAALTLTGCPNPCADGLPIYNFHVEAHFSPEQDSIQVGDTLFLVSKLEKKLIPIGSQDVVDYSNANINGNLSVFELVPNERFAKDAVFSFDYVSMGGQIYNFRDIPRPDGTQQFIYQELADKYLLKIAFIPKKKGIYGLGILTVASKGRKGSNSCNNASFNPIVTNADINDHFRAEFNELARFPESPRPDNTYYFKVY